MGIYSCILAVTNYFWHSYYFSSGSMNEIIQYHDIKAMVTPLDFFTKLTAATLIIVEERASWFLRSCVCVCVYARLG